MTSLKLKLVKLNRMGKESMMTIHNESKYSI